MVATAGGDATVKLFDRASEQVLATLSGHTKKVHGERASMSAGCVLAAGRPAACARAPARAGLHRVHGPPTQARPAARLAGQHVRSAVPPAASLPLTCSRTRPPTRQPHLRLQT